MINPTILKNVGDTASSGRVLAILWIGASTAGDTVALGSLWEGRAVDAHTYLGINFAPYGIPVQGSITLTQISSGKVFIYYVES